MKKKFQFDIGQQSPRSYSARNCAQIFTHCLEMFKFPRHNLSSKNFDLDHICLYVRPMVKANLKIVAFKARFWQKSLRFLKSGGIERDGATGKHQRLLRRYKYFRMSLHTRVFISSSFGDMQVYKGLCPTRNPRNDVVENNHSSK